MALKILSLESTFDQRDYLRVHGKEMRSRLKGRPTGSISRDDAIRVIDYKTGSVQAAELKLKSWDKLTSDPKMAKAFQLLVIRLALL